MTLSHMYGYKVLTEKDSAFAGGFDAEAIEEALNSFAAVGWRVSQGLGIASLKTSGSSVMFVLERPVT